MRVWLATDAELSLTADQLRAAHRLATQPRRPILGPVTAEPVEQAVLRLAALRLRAGSCIRHGVHCCDLCPGVADVPRPRVRVLPPA